MPTRLVLTGTVPLMMHAFGSNASTHNFKTERVLALCAQVSVTAMRAAGVAAQDGQKKGRRVRALSTQRRRCSC
jgi:hypothetical protein